MRLTNYFLTSLGWSFVTANVLGQTNFIERIPASPRPTISIQTTNYLDLVTNGPTVVQVFRITQSWTNPYPSNNPVIMTNPVFVKLRESIYSWTNSVFDSFRPESLSHAIWTNFLALTNGRNLSVWSVRTHPADWPTNPPVVAWNTNCVIWGMKGLTALSPCWQGEVNPGQVPLTALTRRHVYTRGHGLGPEGFNSTIAGYKAWFVTTNNSLVEAVIKRMVVRASMGANGVRRDYSILLFDRNLPDSIEPVRVITMAEMQAKYPVPTQGLVPHPIFGTEQGGYVSTDVAPLVVNTWKGGDSGSPNLLPLPGELAFFSGRSTTGPTQEMQEDMDELCRLERLDPKDYQLHWVDLSKYPSY